MFDIRISVRHPHHLVIVNVTEMIFGIFIFYGIKPLVNCATTCVHKARKLMQNHPVRVERGNI